ncbi:MAG: alpha/beta fold hydrolase [Leptospiraceae bacterium]|nr:alpha/beta fold hydrolase [Leptospiraceae bacterium]MCK6381944.1 alpha/beta fold hydrolase [Leptospiraceae bacterium]NUM41817.1 alpha/beta fold hydrolase [Leptospiraceae bacterium]
MKNKKIFIIGILVAVLIALPFLMDREVMELNDEIRKNKSGNFISLSDGVVHYELGGSQKGELVVLVHGFTMPSFVYDNIFRALVDSGFQVLRYDLYGRGLSDRPKIPNNTDLFDRQLVELLEKLKIQKQFKLIGSSMGGIVVCEFAVRHPEKVKSVVFISPAGFPLKIPFAGKLVKLPYVGEYVMKTFGDISLMKGTSTSFEKPDAWKKFQVQFEEQFLYKGFKYSILSSLRNMPFGTHKETFRRLGKLKIPTLLVWGKNDKVVPYSSSEVAMEVMPKADFFSIADAGHTPHYDTPEKVIPRIIEFLKNRK